MECLNNLLINIILDILNQIKSQISSSVVHLLSGLAGIQTLGLDRHECTPHFISPSIILFLFNMILLNDDGANPRRLQFQPPMSLISLQPRISHLIFHSK
jgi:hypothetical protein